MTDVSIIIVNYNTLPLVRECIKSIEKHTSGIDYEIIIVDNNSNDDLIGLADKFPNSNVRTLSLPQNIGFGRACNAGTEISSGRNIFFLNPDTILINNAIAILSNFLNNHPQVGACGGNLYDTNLQPTLSYRRLFPGFFWEINEFLNCIPEKFIHPDSRLFNYSDSPINVCYITGADLMVRKSILDQVGGFRPEFFMYYEETDLCRRITKAGWKIYSVPDAKIQHLEGGSFQHKDIQINYNQINRVETGRRTFYRVNFNPLARIFLSSIYFLTLLSRALMIKDKKKKATWRHKLKVFHHH